MRKASTPAEAAMWEIVRGDRLGVRFRRQQPIGPFTADFFCAEHGLIVELDGAQHGDDPSKDERRTRWLEARGCRVLRFANSEVMADLEGIHAASRAALSPPH